MRVKAFALLVGLLCVSKLFYGQSGFPYDSAWRRIEVLIQKRGLPQSALSDVNKVYAAAQKDKREDQWIKAAIYRIQLTEAGEDQPGFRPEAWDSAMAGAPATVKAVLQSAEAQALRNYSPGRRYRRNDAQINVTGDSSRDLSTWPQEKIDLLVKELFLRSLTEAPLLKKTFLKGYEAVLEKGNARKLRPTLYDLLIFRALDYFTESFTDNSPGDAPVSADARLFAAGPDFTHAVFSGIDTVQNLRIAVRLYQDILLFHAPDGDASAYVDADVDRIRFARTASVHEQKDSLYLSALARIRDSYPDLPVAAQAGFLQAAWYEEQGQLYEPLKDTSHRYDLVKAVSIAGSVAAMRDSSQGRANSKALLTSIKTPRLGLQSEKVNLPGIPFRVLLSYRNVATVFGRVIRIDSGTGAPFGREESNNPDWKKLSRSVPVRKFAFKLPPTADFQQHLVELPVDGLPVGVYAILTGSDSLFSDNSAMAVTYFSQSGIAYVRRGNDFFVVDRRTGVPLNHVEIRSYHRRYDYKAGRNLPVLDGHFVTDASGHFRSSFGDAGNYSGRNYVFSYGKDFLSSTEDIYVYSFDNAGADTAARNRAEFEKKWLRASLFIDRGIYRPGQTLFVKSILMTRDFGTRFWKSATGVSSKLYLLDMNEQAVDSVSYKSGEFGSFSSSFKLPQTGLTGSFGVRDSATGTTNNFSVEEYKRPKFFVKLDTVGAAVRLNDSIRFTGTATSYAGAAVNDAQVTYRIYREASYPYPWYFRQLPASSETELTQGELHTDPQGRFSVTFQAKPDPTADLSTKPVFHFRLAVSVTDGNGETREGTASTAVSAESFQFYSDLPRESIFPTDSLSHFPVSSRDANGNFIARSITVSLYALEMPARMIRERYWPQPDLHLMDSGTYTRTFPTDEYADETNKATWKIKEKIISKSAVTTAEGFFPLVIKNSAGLSGWYLVTFAGLDRNGDSITDKRWIELGANKRKTPAYPVLNAVSAEERVAEPGGSVDISTGSSAAQVYVIRARTPVEDSLTRFSHFLLQNEIKRDNIAVTAADRGGFSIQDVFVLDNRWYSCSHLVYVPWTDKILDVHYSTWKDKTLPGSKETWELQLSGKTREIRTAEVLTAMYDASLDQFNPGKWDVPSLYPALTLHDMWTGRFTFGAQQGIDHLPADKMQEIFVKRYDQLFEAGAGRPGGGRMAVMRSMSFSGEQDKLSGIPARKMASAPVMEKEARFAPPTIEMDRATADSTTLVNKNPVADPASGNAATIRKNFNETAFFFPDLHTDAGGNVSFSFTMPEALTKWKWSVFAHTKDLAFGLGEKSVITQKDLMLMPNMPRFLRQGDSLQIPVKISNLSEKDITGKVKIDWRDAADSSERNTAFGNRNPEQSFSIPAGQSRTYFFPTSVPKGQDQPVYYRLIASTEGATQLSDGEEGILPVLTNRKLVTEAIPIRLNRENSKRFDFDKLLHSDSSKTLQQHSLTVEYTTRPAWYAVQSLPYLMEFPYECAEQTFDRYYANALGQEIVSRVPGMAGVMAAWKSGDTAALQSNLQKNEELKTVLLKETPWVLEGQTETAQKQSLARLLDREKLGIEMNKAISKLKAMQSDAGGFPWFAGGRDDRYITQYVLTGIGHLIKLKALPLTDQPAYLEIVKKALGFLDAEMKRDYDNRPKKITGTDLSPLQIQYLYLRSFFADIDLPGASFAAVNYYRKQAQQHWVDQNMYLRGMIALFLNRSGDKRTAQEIMKSLRENAISNEKDGMYWKRSGTGYYWQESPVETQSLLIEAFAELGQAGETDNMKWWLLQQKQATHWNSTRSTADACYALLMNGADWLGTNQEVQITLGHNTISSGEEKTEAGTGYLKKVFPGDSIRPDMGHITVTTAAATGKPVPSFGAVYWQYFEEPGNITAPGGSLNLTRTLFLQKNTTKGVVGEAVAPGAVLHVGDKLILRFIIKTDRDLSYVHLQDQRAACLEPVDALSGYRWQGELGFYQAPGDQSSSFFFDFLPKGTHVVEYPVYVTTNGVFSAGISTLQTMYAPEFAAHTAGSRLQVTEK